MTRGLAARVLYGALFVAVLPAALALWAHGAVANVRAVALHWPMTGAALIAAGAAAMLAGMAALWRRGGGLPMNAFPPPRLVEGGIYALVPHPIYGGFVLACAGAALTTGSASGLWLVTPSVALACAALVLGYELPDLRKRFGARETSVWLPRDGLTAPTMLERIRVYLVVLLPWLVVFELLGLLLQGHATVETYLDFERGMRVMPAWEPVYASTYVAVGLVPLLAGSGAALRRFALQGLRAMALVFPVYLLAPLYVPPKPFEAATMLGRMVGWERTPIAGVEAFPSFHVVWALIAAAALGEGRRWKRTVWWTWAALVAVSCVTTGMHAIADVAAGVATFLLVARMGAVWHAALRGAERVANSWREWRVGPMRVINHGAYAGAGAVVGMLIIETLLGPGLEVLSLTICVGTLVGAALWAQWVEGSPALLRPMGFYGGMLGGIAASFCAPLLHTSVWTALAAVTMATPWIQGIGRLRCLVQGCCHGREAKTLRGIRYTHPRSRVCRLAEMTGVPVYATPVYSMVCNIVTGAVLLRLLTLHASAAMLCGVYLLLSGLGRFVEEAYRGEPQTMQVWGMHLYQWIAVATVVAGAALTCVTGTPGLETGPLRVSSIAVALGCGALAWFATGVDFPESSRRFARLT